VEGCNLRCSFCGLNGIRGKENEFKQMSLRHAEDIADQIAELGWNPRLEFAMHGEPSAHRKLDTVLRKFRSRLPNHHMMMTSNGYGFLSDITLVDQVLESVNVLALDSYDGIKIVPRILKRYEGKHDVRYYPKDKTANPHKRRKPSERLLVVIKDIDSATSGNHATLNNHAGAGAPKNDRLQGKRCAKPFREMSIRWDGNVAICCNDWRGVYKCGYAVDEGIEEIWNGPEFVAARKKLYNGQRDFGPCDGCDAASYRTGLLPDKMGKQELSGPSESDLVIIEEACAGRSYTEPVLRDWESKT